MATKTKANVTVKFSAEKITKNTVRFAEKLENEYAAPDIGTVYIPKATLGKIGYGEGKTIVVTITVE